MYLEFVVISVPVLHNWDIGVLCEGILAMASLIDPVDVEGSLPTVIVLLKNVIDSIVDNNEALIESDEDASIVNRVTRVHESLVHMNTIIALVLHGFRLSHA